MNERITIVAYKPLPGKEHELTILVSTHHPRLLKIDLVTDREPIVMQAEDGSILEVFEWKSKEAIQAAHSHPDVLAMWKEFSEVCNYLPTSAVKEIGNMFSEFTPIN